MNEHQTLHRSPAKLLSLNRSSLGALLRPTPLRLPLVLRVAIQTVFAIFLFLLFAPLFLFFALFVSVAHPFNLAQ